MNNASVTNVHVLNTIANRIEATLAVHRLHGRIVGGQDTAFGRTFVLQPAATVSPDRIFSARSIIAQAMRSDKISLAQVEGFVHIREINRYTGNDIFLSDLITRYGQLGEFHAVAGLREDGEPLAINLASSYTPHMLISGTTGSGKSVLAQTILTSLTHLNRPHRLNVVVLDPKGGDERLINNLSHHMPLPVAITPDEQYLALEHVVSVMLSRRNSLVMPRIVVYCDELADTALAGGKAALELLSRIAARGRSAGIHILGCTQNPSAKSLPEDLRRNLPLRLVGKVSNAVEAKMATGIGDTGAEMLAGRGAFIACVNGETMRLQAALPDLDIVDPCSIPDWPAQRGFVHNGPIVLPAQPLPQLCPPAQALSASDIASLPSVTAPNEINLGAVIRIIQSLRNEGRPVNRSTVLTAMGKPTGGAHWRQITSIWNAAMNAA